MGFVERLQAAKQRSMKWYCLSLDARAEQGDANNLKMVPFLTVAAKHCRKAEHSLQLAAGSFNLA
jgi:hypothetical protein